MIAHGVSRGVRVIQEPSPGRGEKRRMGDKLFTPCLSPFRAHSSICLVPRLPPWAIVLHLSEANPRGA